MATKSIQTELLDDSRIERIKDRIRTAGQTRMATRKEGKLARNAGLLDEYAEEHFEKERADDTTSLFVEVAHSVDAEVVLHFSQAHEDTAEVYVDGEFIAFANVRATKWANEPCTVNRRQKGDLGEAIDRGGAVGRLSLPDAAYQALRAWKGWDETPEETCSYPNCGRQAHMQADQGPSCVEHYDELC